MNLIVNVDSNWAIGYKNRLLFPIPADLKNFKRLTDGKIVIMGRKTLESLPKSKPLSNRKNIVLSKKLQTPSNNEYLVCNSVENLFVLLKNNFPQVKTEDVFVIGGEQVYRALIPFCSVIYVTKVNKAALNADTFFPNLDKSTEWKIIESSELLEYDDISFNFLIYGKHE